MCIRDRGGRRLGGCAGGERSERTQVLVLLLAQLQGTGEGVEDGRAGPRLPAAFQPGVVVDAHARQGGQFLPAQPRGAAQPGARRQARLLGRHLSAPGTQEAPQLGAPGAATVFLMTHAYRV